MRKYLLIILILLVPATGYFYFSQKSQREPIQKTITSFEECVEAGNPVMESYPPQCRAEGKTFTEDIGNELEKTDMIKITEPRPNQLVTSPMLIRGNARGNWFFEANFPVSLYDANDNLLTVNHAQAQEEWMTEEFVYYESKLIFETPTTDTGTLVLEKSNPSGLPENDDKMVIPVRFR